MGHFSLSFVPPMGLGMQMLNLAADANEVILDILVVPIIFFYSERFEEHQRAQDLCH